MDFLTWRKTFFGYYGRYYGTVYTVPCQGNHYCLTDGIAQADDTPATQSFSYKGHQMILACQTDIDLGGQVETRQSTSGYILYLCGCIVQWREFTGKLVLKSSSKHLHATRSSTCNLSSYTTTTSKRKCSPSRSQTRHIHRHPPYTLSSEGPPH
jgi:hypothetical protein